MGYRCSSVRRRFRSDRRVFHRLIDIRVGIIREPEIAVMPEHDAQSHQQQAQRPHHKPALPAVFGRPSTQPPRKRGFGLRHKSFKDRHCRNLGFRYLGRLILHGGTGTLPEGV